MDGGLHRAVEAHNPALTATGLAVWGWILRIVVAISFLILPQVITTATTPCRQLHRRHRAAGVPDSAALLAVTDPGAKPPPVAPASVISRTRLDQATGTNALAQILRNFPKTHPSSLTELQAFGAARLTFLRVRRVLPPHGRTAVGA